MNENKEQTITADYEGRTKKIEEAFWRCAELLAQRIAEHPENFTQNDKVRIVKVLSRFL